MLQGKGNVLLLLDVETIHFALEGRVLRKDQYTVIFFSVIKLTNMIRAKLSVKHPK